jgi:hypothetical protein
VSASVNGFRTATVVVALFFGLIFTPHAGGQALEGEAATRFDLPDGRSYAIAAGTLYRYPGTTGWEPVEGLPVRVLPAARAGEPLPVTAVAADPASPGRVLAAVGARLFESDNGALSWSELDLTEVINPSTYITAIAVDPRDPAHLVLGTSYDGLYVSPDAGASWRDVTQGWTIAPLYLGAGFYEEIAGLRFEPDGTVIATLGMGGGFVSLDLEARTARRLRPVVDGPDRYRATDARAPGSDLAGLQQIPGRAGADGPTGNPLRAGNPGPGAAGPAGEEAGRRQAASGQTGIYVSAANASREKLPGYFDLIDRHGYSSIVVDFKDDFGRVTYDTSLATPRAAGAVEPLVAVDTLMELAEERGVYVIARIVVFKDPRLYRYEGNRFALWDSERNAPWGVFRRIVDEETQEERVVQVEHWVDPFSEEVWEYNIAIAEEVVALGADEVQFDYIRFPSDGNTDTVVSRFAPEGADRVQALEAFLATARERLEVPVGIDVFGFNAWSRMSYLGQDIGRLSRYVDVISPMFYPSHFARAFLPEHSYLERSFVIYDEGTRRAREIAHGTLIRPYIQSFLIGSELRYEEPEYRRYLELQLEGADRARADGFTLWNASGRYYMLE